MLVLHIRSDSGCEASRSGQGGIRVGAGRLKVSQTAGVCSGRSDSAFQSRASSRPHTEPGWGGDPVRGGADK